MFFKRSVWIFLGFGLLFSGCDLKKALTDGLNEKPLPPQAPIAQGFETKCLSGVLPVMREFMKGSAQAGPVSEAWECFANSIAQFGKYVRGGEADKYTPREVAAFFEKFILVDVTISDALLTEIMALKKLFVGGSETAITVEELRDLQSFAIEMRGLSMDLLPYMKVFSQSWVSEPGVPEKTRDEYFEDANLALQKAAKKIAERIQRHQGSYRLDRLVKLLANMAQLYGETWGFVNQLGKVMPLLENLKVSLTGGDEKIVAADEWERFSLLLARGFVQYLRFKYFVSGEEFPVVYVFRSISDLFSLLGEMVASKPGQVLSLQELSSVSRQLGLIFPDFVISEEMLKQAMKIKKLFFGGSEERWTPEEFLVAQGKLKLFQSFTETSIKNLIFISGQWKPQDPSSAEAEDFYRQSSQVFLQSLLSLSESVQGDYDLRDLMIFMEELEKTAQTQVPSRIRQFVPVIREFKNILFSENNSIVNQSSWRPLLEQGGHLFNRYLFYQYFLKGRSASLKSLRIVVGDLYSDLLRILEIKKRSGAGSEKIALQEINQLIDALDFSAFGKGVAESPLALSKSVLKELARAGANRWFVFPELRLRPGFVAPGGFNKDSFLFLKNELNVWMDSQATLVSMFSGVRSLARSRIISALELASAFPGNLELIRVLQTPVQFPTDGDRRVIIEPRQTRKEYTLESVAYHNTLRAVLRVIVRSYASDLSRAGILAALPTTTDLVAVDRASLTVSEMTQLFSEIPELIQLLGIDESNIPKFVQSRFREANLFSPRGDGDGDGKNDFLNFREGMDLLLLLLSGLNLNERMTQKIEQICNPRWERNRATTQISFDCYVRAYRQALRSDLGSIPYFARTLAAQPYEDRDPVNSPFGQSMMTLLKASGTTDFSQGGAQLADLALVPQAMQYIESTLQRFDTNADGILDRAEGLSSYPVFAETLQSLSGFAKPEDNRALLAYILEKGHPPQTTGQKIKFALFYRRNEKAWKIQADRIQIARILGFINEAAADTKTLGKYTYPIDQN